VAYDLERERTAITLSTDASPFTDARIDAEVRLRELETQARRTGRHRALQRCHHGPTPRAGNDGEPGGRTSGRGQWFGFLCSTYLSSSGPWTEIMHVPEGWAYGDDAGEIELPAGRVTKIRAVFGTNITAGTITLTPQKAAASDTRADGDVDSWTAYDVPDGQACELSAGACSRRVEGWSFELADGETLGVKAEASGDFAADVGDWLYVRLYFEEG
jgi:hypothetical protein